MKRKRRHLKRKHRHTESPVSRGQSSAEHEHDDQGQASTKYQAVVSPLPSDQAQGARRRSTASKRGGDQTKVARRRSTVAPAPSDQAEGAARRHNVASEQADTQGQCFPLQRHQQLQGRKFGRYILESKLGSGGMGTVYKAYHPGLDNYFALKMILPEKLGPVGLKRFQREARVARKLKHPNIIAVHDVGVEKGRHYIVMDYIPGRDLQQLIRKKRFWPRPAFELMLEIVEALEYSHSQGIVHRDIKPSNIMVTTVGEREKAYLMDFGMASVVQDTGLTRTGQIIGTPQYMSPEQARGEKLDGRSDIYSLGTVLYEMLTCQSVVAKGHIMAVLFQVVHEQVPLLSQHVQVAREVEAIVMKCLAKELPRRYQKAAELAADIKRYLRGEPVLARRPSLLYRLWRKGLQYRKLFLGITFLLALGVLLVFWLQYKRATTQDRMLARVKDLMATNKLDAMEQAQHICDELLKTWPNYEPAQTLRQKATTKCRTLNSQIQQELKQGWKYFAQHNLEAAQKSCQHILHIAGTSKSLKKHGGKTRTLQQLEKEIQRYQQVRDDYARIMRLFRHEGLNRSIVCYCFERLQAICQADPKFTQAFFQAGRAGEKLARFNKTIKYYQKAIALAPHSLAKYRLWSLQATTSAIKSNKFISIFHQIWGHKPKLDDLYSRLAQAQYQLYLDCYYGRISKKKESDMAYRAGLQLCNDLIKDFPACYDAYLIRAQLNSYCMSLSAQDKVHKIIHYTKVMRNPEQALADYATCIYLEPNRPAAYYLRGIVYHRIKDYQNAEQDFNVVLHLSNKYILVYRERAACYAAQNQFQKAFDDLQQAARYHYRLLDQCPPKCDIIRLDLTGDLTAILLAMTVLSSCLPTQKDHKQLRPDVYFHEYLRLRERNNEFFDDLVYAVFYLLNSNDMHKVEQHMERFLRNHMKMLLPIQIVLQQCENECPGFTDKLTRLSWNAENLFCAKPQIKHFRYRVRGLMQTLRMIAEHTILVKLTEELMGNSSVFTRHCLKYLEREKLGRRKRQVFNSIVRRICPPLNADIFFCGVNFFSDNIYIKQLEGMQHLPSAIISYRRAVSYYIKHRLMKATKDLEQALDYEPYMMSAHYGLSTVYALLLKQALRPEKKRRYRRKALYHLREAVLNGWPHLQTYTLHDEDFSALHLERLPPQTLQLWEAKRHNNAQRLVLLQQHLQTLLQHGQAHQALHLLHDHPPVYISSWLFQQKFGSLWKRAKTRVMNNYLKAYLDAQKSSSQKHTLEQNYYRKKRIEQRIMMQIREAFGSWGVRQWQLLTHSNVE